MLRKLRSEELRNQMLNHRVPVHVLLWLAVSLTVRYAFIGLGLYFWFSYVLLGVFLGMGCIYLGSSWKKALAGETRFQPLILMGTIAALPLLVTGLDELFLHTMIKSGGPAAIAITDMSNTALWLASPEGHIYFHTQRNVMSDRLWLMSSVCMLVLFALGYLSSKWHMGRDLAAAL